MVGICSRMTSILLRLNIIHICGLYIGLMWDFISQGFKFPKVYTLGCRDGALTGLWRWGVGLVFFVAGVSNRPLTFTRQVYLLLDTPAYPGRTKLNVKNKPPLS